MTWYTDKTYGERVAEVYDDWYGDYDPNAIARLTELAQGDRVLELGIGTGRIALPLQQNGIEVYGIDAAPAMVDRLRAKPGGDRIPVTLGNFADVAVEGEFALIYIVFNTFFALLSQREQVRCFRNAATHLGPSGCFLIEAFVPDLTRFDGGQTNRAVRVAAAHVDLDVSQHDTATQHVISQKVILSEGNVRLYPVQIRYAYPPELDLMAQLAGLQLRERWANWSRESFTSQSEKHISIYDRVTYASC